MALFFDQVWFDAKLAARGAAREDIARLLQLSPAEVDEMWKDQRELRAADVTALARFFGVSAAEIAVRAGVSTPVPAQADDIAAQLAAMNERLTRIERMIVELKTLVLTPKG